MPPRDKKFRLRVRGTAPVPETPIVYLYLCIEDEAVVLYSEALGSYPRSLLKFYPNGTVYRYVGVDRGPWDVDIAAGRRLVVTDEWQG